MTNWFQLLLREVFVRPAKLTFFLQRLGLILARDVPFHNCGHLGTILDDCACQKDHVEMVKGCGEEERALELVAQKGEMKGSLEIPHL